MRILSHCRVVVVYCRNRIEIDKVASRAGDVCEASRSRLAGRVEEGARGGRLVLLVVADDGRR